MEQTSWILFLKYLDDLEKDRATAAELTGKSYTPIINEAYRWGVWAAPRKPRAGAEKAQIDHNALTGDDFPGFVNNQLFPFLQSFKQSAERSNT